MEFVVYDDQSQPQSGASLREADHAGQSDAVMGPYSSAISEAVANVSEKYRLPMVAPMVSSTSIFKKGRKFIMVQSPAEAYLRAWSTGPRSPRRRSRGRSNWPRRGASRSSSTKPAHGQHRLSALLVQVRAANPDVLGAATYFDDAMALTRQMKGLNVNPKMYGAAGGDLPKFYERLGKNAEFGYGSDAVTARATPSGVGEFVEVYDRGFPGFDHSYHSAGGSAGGQVLVEAIRSPGPSTARRSGKPSSRLTR